ncbi:MAG: hypothetical protein N3G78_13385 [Desulfobacterota bacterium]|nr:hypothetical protein [Thermodesulfobacteriota bacterium]
MGLTLSDLQKGIDWWRKEKGGKWPQDFHNRVYHEIYDLRKDGLTERWWWHTVDRLWEWRAIRSKKPPNTKREIWERGLEVLDTLQRFYTDIKSKADQEPVFLNFKWSEIEELYEQLSGIKMSRSPNFPSKLGHFIFPKLFIVMDHEATGIEDYGQFWTAMAKAWENFKEKAEAKAILEKEISKSSRLPVHENYPFEIKIIELCHIGRRHRIV